jgi:hypothetical protein
MVHYGIAEGLRVYFDQRKGRLSPGTSALKKVVSTSRTASLFWIDKTIEDRGGIELMDEEELEIIESLRHDAPIIAARTLENMNLTRFRVVAFQGKPMVELSLTAPIFGWDGFHTTLDVVLEEIATGDKWLLDWKVRKQFTPVEAEEVNLQKVCYQHVLRHHGVEVQGTIMFQIKSQAPAIPRLNQNGSMSRARVATDWPTYKAALIANNLNPDDYQSEMEPKLDVEFMRETRCYRSAEEVESFWNGIVVPAAREMRKVVMSLDVNPGRIFRTMNHYTCNGCWARAFCLGELRGEDLDFLLRTDYIDEENPASRLVMSADDFEIVE